jgi:hypothetical protein
MSKFVTNRDVGFFKGINLEIIDDIIETGVVFFSLIPEKQNANIYGEATDKIYEPGIHVNALIQHDDETTEDDSMISNVYQNILAAFYRNTLKEKDFYPERGDLVKYYNAYYEVTQIIDNALLAGRVGLPWSIICICQMVNRSSINVRQEL